mmetsp:Transcript_853/g.5320  ORF Transcript_853/g.5320 Transcript_853/m.5320 type:complete len:613 (+) Transcript_853:922-2760(+)
MSRIQSPTLFVLPDRFAAHREAFARGSCQHFEQAARHLLCLVQVCGTPFEQGSSTEAAYFDPGCRRCVGCGASSAPASGCRIYRFQVFRGQDFVWVQDEVRIEHLLDLCGYAEVILIADQRQGGQFQLSDAVFCADAPTDGNDERVDIVFDFFPHLFHLVSIVVHAHVEMHVPVSEVSESEHLDVFVFSHCFSGPFHQTVHVYQGQAHVVFEHVSNLSQGFGDAFSQHPVRFRLRFVLGHDAASHQSLSCERIQERPDLGRVVFRAASCCLEQHVKLVFFPSFVLVVGERMAQVVHPFDGCVQAGTIHVFCRGQDLREVFLGAHHRLHHRFVRVDVQEDDVDGVGARHQSQRDLGDDAKRSFCADEELLQIDACVVLLSLLQRGHHRAVRQHRFHAQHRSTKRSVSHVSRSCGVRGHQSAHLASSLRAQVHGHRVMVLLGDAIEVFQHASGFHHRDPFVRVHVQHASHARRAQHHLVAHRNAAAHQSGVAALRHHGDAMDVAVAQHALHLLRRARLEHRAAPSHVTSAPVAAVRFQRIRVPHHAIRVQQLRPRSVGGIGGDGSDALRRASPRDAPHPRVPRLHVWTRWTVGCGTDHARVPFRAQARCKRARG